MSGLLFGVLLAAPVAVPAAQVERVEFECALALATPQGGLTAPSPVTISFSVEDKVVGDIHVVDAGGILYPGGNMRVVQKPDAASLESVAFPAERPGEWLGTAEKKLYRLTLKSGALAKAVEIGIGRLPGKETGRVGLVWNATNQPEGMPAPISGKGVGNCAIKSKDSQ